MSGDHMSLLVQQVGSIYLNQNALEIAKLLEDSYEGDFSEQDWQHTFGGARFVGTLDDQIVAHAAVVPREVWIP
jgi:aminoglycoside 2'-N-acetyltransferase I